MGLLRTGCFIVLAILLCAWASRSSDEKKATEEVLPRQLVDPASGEIDANLAEELWFYCKLDVIHLKEFVQELGLSFPKEIFRRTHEIEPKGLSLARENIRKTISLLDPQAKQTLLDCIQNHNLLFCISGEDSGSKKWYSKYFESIFPGDNVPRRYLQTISVAPTPAPTTGLPSPSPGLAPPPSQPNSFDPHAPSPRTTFFPPAINDANLGVPPAENSSSGAGSGPDTQPDKKSNSHKPVVIAVAVTASVTFVVVVLFFLCCGGFCKPGSKLRQNDERPLLSLSLSEFSAASSPNFYAFGNSKKEEGLGHQSFGNNSSQHRMGSSLDGNFNTPSNVVQTSLNNTVSTTSDSEFKTFDISNKTNSQAPFPPLKLPPGRVGTPSLGMPPLKPPPGRADPLPPEPPASFKPPSTKPGPPPPPSTKPGPPPPPVPPTCLKPVGSLGPPVPRPSPPPPPLPPGSDIGPRPPPPPPPKGGVPPPQPPQLPLGSKGGRPPPRAPKHPLNASSSGGADLEGEADAPKAKLKPFFWDKVLANPDHSMVWHQIKSGSFQFDENMIETLFGYAATNKGKSEQKKESASQDPSPQFIQIIDPKKSQNLAILLRALNVRVEEVCDALCEGNELPSEFLQSLLKMAPTTDEELKLRMFNGELSQLGPAERFLKVLIDIPFAFKRLEALLFMSTLTEEVAIAKESFATLEVACKELRNSRLFLKLLEAVLKTGNRMNDGTFRGGAQAFKLDTLLKLSDVKGTDGKTTLLHFVVQEIIRSEGIRAVRVARESQSLSSIKSDDLLEEASNDMEEHYRSLGLQVVSGLGNELEYVKRAAVLDADSLTGAVAKLGQSLAKTRKFLNSEMKSLEEDGGFCQTLENFVQNAEVEISWLLEEEKRITALVKSTGDYFHGNAGKDEGLRLFIIVRDFLIMLAKACKEVREAPKKPLKVPKKETSSPDLHQLATPISSSNTRQSPVDLRERLFPVIKDRRVDYSSSDDEGP